MVDDHEAVRALTVQILNAAGYDVAVACSVAQAEDILRRRNVDIVLTDLVMPGGNGHRIAATRDARGVHPRIVYMSGYTEATISRDDLLVSNTHFLEKPFTPDTLLSAIAEAVDA